MPFSCHDCGRELQPGEGVRREVAVGRSDIHATAYTSLPVPASGSVTHLAVVPLCPECDGRRVAALARDRRQTMLGLLAILGVVLLLWVLFILFGPMPR